jgi:hypothetical protein
MQPPYWSRKSKKLTRSTRLEEENLGTYATTQSKRDLKRRILNLEQWTRDPQICADLFLSKCSTLVMCG